MFRPCFYTKEVPTLPSLNYPIIFSTQYFSSKMLSHSNSGGTSVSLNSSKVARKRTDSYWGTVMAVGRRPLAADSGPPRDRCPAQLWGSGSVRRDAASLCRFPIAPIGDPTLNFNSCKTHLLKTFVILLCHQ